MMESNELSKASEPHKSPKTCSKRQVVDSRAYIDDPLKASSSIVEHICMRVRALLAPA